MSCEVCAGYDSYKCPVCGEQIKMVTCPMCKGTGEGDWKVYDRVDDVVLRATRQAYNMAALNEEDAEGLNERYCRESNTCQTCKGLGEIPENMRINRSHIINKSFCW